MEVRQWSARTPPLEHVGSHKEPRMEPAANLSVDVQPVGTRLALSLQAETALPDPGRRLHNTI
jgi:hypothetical protein